MKTFLSIVGIGCLIALTAIGCQKQKHTELLAADAIPPMEVIEMPAEATIYDAPPLSDAMHGSDPVAVAPQYSGTYTIQRGDTLWSIAKRNYGDGRRWQEIAAVNPGIEPHKLPVGLVLRLP